MLFMHTQEGALLQFSIGRYPVDGDDGEGAVRQRPGEVVRARCQRAARIRSEDEERGDKTIEHCMHLNLIVHGMQQLHT